MTRFWLTYRQHGRLLGVVVVDSPSLSVARRRAANAGIDRRAQFASGTELFAELAAQVPATAIGRVLGPVEAAKLVRRLEHGIPKLRRRR